MRTVQTQNFVKILRAVFEIWTKNIKNAPKMGVFPHLRPPKIFFQKSGSVTFVPLWCTNFMQKIRKILRAVSEIFKDGLRTTDGLTDGQGRLLRTPSGKPGVQNDFTKTFPTLTEASSTKVLKIYLILYKELLLPL